MAVKMKPIEFKGQNTVFAKDQPQYRQLPAHRSEDGTVTSCWHLTFRERLNVLVFGRMYIRIMTFNRPLQPILPAIENPIEP
jgi:hypothetical protein